MDLIRRKIFISLQNDAKGCIIRPISHDKMTHFMR